MKGAWGVEGNAILAVVDSFSLTLNGLQGTDVFEFYEEIIPLVVPSENAELVGFLLLGFALIQEVFDVLIEEREVFGIGIYSIENDDLVVIHEETPVRYSRVSDTITPDFDGDGTVGFPDFLQFAAQFGLSQGDAGYDARFDLDDVSPRTSMTAYFAAAPVAKCDRSDAFRDTPAGPTRRPTISCRGWGRHSCLPATLPFCGGDRTSNASDRIGLPGFLQHAQKNKREDAGSSVKGTAAHRTIPAGICPKGLSPALAKDRESDGRRDRALAWSPDGTRPRGGQQHWDLALQRKP